MEEPLYLIVVFLNWVAVRRRRCRLPLHVIDRRELVEEHVERLGVVVVFITAAVLVEGRGPFAGILVSLGVGVEFDVGTG